MRKRILVTGSEGLVGKAVYNVASKYKQYDLVYAGNSKDYDLTDSRRVLELFERTRPNYVLHLAARVGGIGLNLNSPAQQFDDNILMNTNIVKTARKYDVEKLIAFSSVCAFPKDVSINLREDNLHSGEPFPAHGSYAYAKRMVDIQIDAYRKQYNCNYCSVIPSNIFGESDQYSLQNGHVVPSLIHKAFLAAQENKPLEVWGDGSPRREFIYSQDLAKVCLDLFSFHSLPRSLIVSTEDELQIKEIVSKIVCSYKKVLDKDIEVKYDETKPNGQLRRPTNTSLFKLLFSNFKFTNIDESILNSVEWFVKNYPNVRK